jgi:hypothetical protein
MFMCINADIETQFEFLQQTWRLGRSFAGLNDESDAMLGHTRMSIQTQQGPLYLKGLSDLVTVRGGGYFFMPSRSAVKLLYQSTENPYASDPAYSDQLREFITATSASAPAYAADTSLQAIHPEAQ